MLELETREKQVKRVKRDVFRVLVGALREVEQTIERSGFTPREVGIELQQYRTNPQGYFVDLRLNI